MKVVLLGVAVLATWTGFAVAETVGGTGPKAAGDHLGLLILTNLPTAPFPHPQRANGHTYKNKFYSAAEHYSSNTVAIFVPDGCKPGGTVDLIVHLHGWQNNVQKVPRQYQLAEQLNESHRDAVLVVPQGPFNAPDSFAGKLEDTNGFKALIGDVLKVLQAQPQFGGKKPTPGRIILSAHSGGYRGVAAILDRGGLTDHVSEVWLFDALYAETDTFIKWIQAQPKGRFLNIYTEHGGTKEETLQMMKRLREAGIRFASYNEGELTPRLLRARQPIFIYTALGHNDVLHEHETFRQFLETSALRE